MHQSLSLADTEGRLLPTLDGGWRWHYSRLATGIKNGAVILLNELSRSLPSNATLFLGLLNERQLQIETLNEVIPVHPDTIFIADQNIGHRYVGTRDQDPALLDRFNVKLEFGDDPAIESQLIPSPALLEIAHALRYLSKQEPSKHRTRVGLRMLLNFVKQAKVYNFTWAVNRFIANFPEAEREAVSLQFEARYINIAQELNVPVGNYDPANN
jgi:MoxR-like ATPase